MESSSSATKFKFRDHQDMDAAAPSEASSDISSISSDPVSIGDDDDDGKDDSDLQSMTAKGIKHLCSELLELKAVSDEEFQKNIFSKYSAFVSIFEEVEGMEDELMKLKNHVLNQKKLVRELVDGICPKLLAEDTMESVSEESAFDELLPPTELEAHINYISETLDILLSENRVDEALDVLEMEDENLGRLHQREGSSSDDLKLYNSVISEGKAVITVKLRLVAENARTAAAELRQALSRLCRLGDRQLATDLLLKYYHSRIETGCQSLENSKSFSNGVYIRELSKFVFSMISQAARSFMMLQGEASPYASELIRWALKETESFASCFSVYIKKISKISGGLSTVVQSLQFAISLCSLLDAQKLVLRPYLIKQILPSVEEALEIHIDHFKKVVAIFTATDSWVLRKYLMPGTSAESCSLVLVGNQPVSCLLTSSGQKLVTLLQAIAQDISPLAALEMESSTIKCLTDLFMEYISTTEKVISAERRQLDRERDDRGVDSMQTLMKQISILMNLTTLECLFSRIIRSILNCQDQIDISNMDEHSVIDNSFSSIQGALDRVQSCFCSQYISRIMSTQYDKRIGPEASSDDPSDADVSHDVKPSVPLQVLFLELRTIRKVAEDVVEATWLMELLQDMIEVSFYWISDNAVISAPHQEKMNVCHSYHSQMQFILDVQFLVEIAKHGGYFSENLEKLRTSALLSIGLDPSREPSGDDSYIAAAGEAIERLLQIEREEASKYEPAGTIEFETEPCELQSVQEDCSSCIEDSDGSEQLDIGRDSASMSATADIPNVPGTESDFADDLICHGEDGSFGDTESLRMLDGGPPDPELTYEVVSSLKTRIEIDQ